MMSEFNRGISPGFINQLAEEAKKNSWWADVLNDPKLFVAVREEHLNVYWRGQSLFCVSNPSGLKVTTHQKYLVDPALASQVPLKTDDSFDVESIVKQGVISRYEGPKTLAKMKKAAGLFSGSEKTGCHEIAVNNPEVIDCEIAFPGIISPHDGGPDETAGRVDLLSLEPADGDTVRLVFWEAKHFNNGELRARGADVPVCKQIARYRQYLSDQQHRGEIVASYKRVVENLIAINKMGWKRPLSPLINKVADGQPLTLGTEPKVGLVIFGFDKAQRDDQNWKKHHLERLEKDDEVARVIAAGDAKNIQLQL